MTEPAAPTDPEPVIPHTREEVRRANRKFFAGAAALLLLFAGLAVTLALTRDTPRDFRHHDPTPDKREAMIVELGAEVANFPLGGRDGGTEEAEAWRQQKILQVAIGVNEYALAHDGDMPYSLYDIGLAEELRDARWRLNRGGPYWRLYDGDKNLVARGD